VIEAPVRRSRRFAHESEERLAELLDFYGIAWEYEPVEFILSWDIDGRPTSGFRPDFFLPEHDLFIELTTLRQELVTRKNRKVRRVQELYPEVKVRVLYRRDYANLLVKAGLLAGAGQLLEPRRAVV
jgi:hypoxanthine phosphoribosyltransferase